MSLSTSARSVAGRQGFPLPKPTESYRKVLREVEGTDNSLIRLIPNRRVFVFRQIEYVKQRQHEWRAANDRYMPPALAAGQHDLQASLTR